MFFKRWKKATERSIRCQRELDAYANENGGYLFHLVNVGSFDKWAEKRGVQVAGFTPAAHIKKGLYLFNPQQLDDAISEFRQALRCKDINETKVLPYWAHNNLGVALFFKYRHDKEKLDNPVEEFRKAIELNAEYTEAHNNLGNVFEWKGQKEQAVEEYRAALRLEPDCAEVHNNLGKVLTDMRKLDEAHRELRRALQLKSDMAETHCNLARALEGNDAHKEYEEAIRLNPDLPQPWLYFSTYYLAKGRIQEGGQAHQRWAKGIMGPSDFWKSKSKASRTIATTKIQIPKPLTNIDPASAIATKKQCLSEVSLNTMSSCAEGAAPAKWDIGSMILGRYKIHDIKMGGMGIVYLCYDLNYKTPVAIKTLKKPENTSKAYSEIIDKFYLEAEAWVRLEKHKNIVHAKGVERIDGQPYVFLEFINENEDYGSDLRGWISKKEKLDIVESLNFALQFCSGMEYAARTFHRMGRPFVHRDIKPENIMVTYDKVIKITDFGLVKIFDHTEQDIFARAGTPAYMSPEQWQGKKEIDCRSDVYSFGCILYEMLSGKTPFQGQIPLQYQYQHMEVRPAPIKTLVPELPENLSNLVMNCLKKVPDERPENFSIIKKELSEIYHDVSGEWVEDETEAEIEAWQRINKGVALCKLGYRKDAVLDYNQAIELKPDAVGSFLPVTLSKVIESFCPAKRVDKLVFHIQSIYPNYTGQKGIAGILGSLVDRYGIRLISLEGGAGKIDLSFYRDLPDGSAKEQVADYFLKQARISGTEYFAITTKENISLYGAEDQELFERNTKVFKSDLIDKDKLVKCCEYLEEAISVLKTYLYNDELKVFEQKRGRLRESVDYMSFLKARIEELSIGGSYPNISLQLEAISLGNQINVIEVNKEKDSFFLYLQQNLKAEQKEGLSKAVHDYSLKEITEYQFYSYVLDVIDKYFSSDLLKRYPNFDLYLQRVVCFGKTDVVELFNELNAAEEAIREKLYTNESQVTLVKYQKHVELLKKFYLNKLIPQEEAYLNERKGEISAEKIVEFISEQAKEHGITVIQTEKARQKLITEREVIYLPEESGRIGKDLVHDNGFYSLAKKRSIALVKNFLEQMDQEQESAGVLITGGFHTKLITAYLKERSIPYIVLVPIYEPSEADDNRYIDAVMGEKTPLEETIGKNEM